MRTKKLFKINHSYRFFLLALCAFLLSGMNASAGTASPDDGQKEAARYLLVWNKSGSCVSFALGEHPRITVDVEHNGVRCVTTERTIDFNLADVHKYTLSADDGSSTGISSAGKDSMIQHREGSLYFSGYAPGTQVTICDLGGTVVSSFTTGGSGTLLVSTAGLRQGVYLIRADKTTYKFIIR